MASIYYYPVDDARQVIDVVMLLRKQSRVTEENHDDKVKQIH